MNGCVRKSLDVSSVVAVQVCDNDIGHRRTFNANLFQRIHRIVS